MKKTIIAASGLLFSLAIFQGCQNCDEAVKTAQTAADSKLTAVTDSLQNAAKTQLDAANSQIQALTDSLAAKTAALEAALTKKPAAAKAPTTQEKQKPKVTSR